jgi:hypothetical protein
MRKVGSRGPFDIKTRYITEDVPVGMVLIASLGRKFGIPTPTFDATIHFCGLMNECYALEVPLDRFREVPQETASLNVLNMQGKRLRAEVVNGRPYLKKCSQSQ